MLLSSNERPCGGDGFLVGGVVAEHGPDDVDPAASERDESLLVRFPFASFPVVERSRCRAVLQTGQRGEIAGAEQSAIEAAGPVEVATDPAGVPWDRRQAGDTREPINGVEAVQVAADVREECRGKRPEPWQAQQHVGALVAGESFGDLGVEVDQFVVYHRDLGRQLGHQSRSDRLGCQCRAL